MPKQEVFFEQSAAGTRIEVLKSYDQSYAREAFSGLGEDALQRLWEALKPEEIYDLAGLPSLRDPDGEAEAFLWDELLEQAREEGSVLSFFVVNETASGRSESLYVSPDWPSAEAFRQATFSRYPVISCPLGIFRLLHARSAFASSKKT